MWFSRAEDPHLYGRLKRGEGIFTPRRFMDGPTVRDPGYRRFMDVPPAMDPAYSRLDPPYRRFMDVHPARDPAKVALEGLMDGAGLSAEDPDYVAYRRFMDSPDTGTYDSVVVPLDGVSLSAEDPIYVGDLRNQVFIEIPLPPYIPKPGEGCKRNSMVQSSGTNSYLGPPCGVTYIFVQGKESACIVSRDLGKGEGIHGLTMDFIGLADVRLTSSSIIGFALEQPANMLCPYALVSVLLNPNDLNEEKESMHDSSHKDTSSRIVNEQAAIDFLKQKLENNTYMGTIQTAISALQCLYQENFKADEIEVYAAQVGQIDKLLPREEIELHLDVINNGTSSTAHLVGS